MKPRHPLLVRRPAKQGGLVLIFAIIVLVAMSLAAVGLMRSMLATNRVAGNLAFQQAAMQTADVAAQTAMAWLDQQARALNTQLGAAHRLAQNIEKSGLEPIAYRASRQDPAAGQSWEAFWAIQQANNLVNEMPINAAGFKASYLIHRLCAGLGRKDSPGSNCEMAPYKQWDKRGSNSDGNQIPAPRETLYRITVRVEGPRNSVSFTQSVISI